MKIGAVFPQTEIGADFGAIKEFAQAVETMGYSHIVAYDHVLGAGTASRKGWAGPYTQDSMFHEPLVLFSYMAGVTSSIEFFTCILILPQRQTALVAKQAACLDVLSNGRLRLGVGTGWNEVEYEALGMNFADRGKRFDEQIEVLRALWTRPLVTINTAAHSINDAGINPLPVQQPIPVWMGGGSDRPRWNSPASDKVIRRIARIGDGWVPMWQPDDRGRELLERFRGYIREYGRNPNDVGLEGRVFAGMTDESKWADRVARWREVGATHLAVVTMDDGLKGAEQHLRRLEVFRKALPAG